jgi:hypothetical protein
MRHPSTRRVVALSLLVLAGAVAPAAAAAACLAGMTRTKPDARYVDHGDGTVTDVVTGLMWMRCAEGQAWSGTACTGTGTSYTWAEAHQQAAAASAAVVAGYADWRLPNIKELVSLVEWACSSPAMNTTVFPGAPNEEFWSSTPFYADFPDSGRTVRFWTGTDFDQGKTIYNRVRLVRAGR